MPDDAFKEKVREVMQESQQQLLLEMNSLIQQISDQNSNSNEKQLLKISSLVATAGMPKFKRKSNEEQFKLNSQVMLKLDEAEQSMDSSNIDKSKEKNMEGKKIIFFFSVCKKKKKKKRKKNQAVADQNGHSCVLCCVGRSIYKF